MSESKRARKIENNEAMRCPTETGDAMSPRGDKCASGFNRPR
jgi:hypothetical protein